MINAKIKDYRHAMRAAALIRAERQLTTLKFLDVVNLWNCGTCLITVVLLCVTTDLQK